MNRIFVATLALSLISFTNGDDKKGAEKKEPEVDGRKLSEWVQRLKSGDVGERQGAVLALGKIGPEGVPALADALEDKEIVNVRLWAAWGLRKNGADAKAAVPKLEAALKDENYLVRVEVAKALWAVAEHKKAISTLIELLNNKDPNIRWGAAESLEWIGPKAKAAVPALQKALNDTGLAVWTNPDGSRKFRAVLLAAGQALKKIDPEAAKKAGVE
jgi:hypothetical protein